MAAAARLSHLALPTLDPIARRRWRSRATQAFGAAVGVVFLVLAVRLLRSELKPEVWAQVPVALAALPVWRVGAAVVAAVAVYVGLGFFDLLAARIVGAPLSPSYAIRTGFMGYALTHNLGLSAFTGTALRLHRYRRRGVAGADVARLYVSNVVTMWLGFAMALGVVIVVAPTGLLPLSERAERFAGATLIAVAVGYVFLCSRHLKPLKVRGHAMALPRGTEAALQVSAGVLNWILAAAVLWLLVPPGPALAEVLTALCFGQVVVVVSHVPGGVGVLEGTLLLMLRGKVDPAALAAGVVLYRAVYYLLPLALACGIVVIEKVVQRHRRRRATAPLAATA
jgi:uncharacterized membrane protein YbhN (UPF0104 family)